MDSPFIYNTYRTGKHFVGHKKDCQVLANLLNSGENVVLYSAPKGGKMSLVQQTLFNMRYAGGRFTVVLADMFNILSVNDFLVKLGDALLKAVAKTTDQFQAIAEEYLSGTHFVFDRSRYNTYDEALSLNWDADSDDMRALFTLPETLAQSRGEQIFVIIKNFHEILNFKELDYESIIKTMEAVLREKQQNGQKASSLIIMGSHLNGMKFIFEDRKFFRRLVEYVPMTPAEDREVIDHMIKGFLATGKVIERDLALGAFKLFRGHLWYINHLCFICDSMSRGYINEGILVDALKCLISTHEPYFKCLMDDLTGHQKSLLKATLDGVVRFSATEVIEKYALNSSANVRRVKDALMKKEIITFNEKDEPVVLDPLFEYWLTNYYYEKVR